MKTNETQTIDADALRARLAETPADLRGRIEAALRALYDLAQRCRVCDDHAATREGHDETRGPLVWRICDRVACEARCLCADCGRDGTSPEPIAPDGIYCLRCGTTRPPRLVPRSTAWRDLPHAAALRAANAAHEAR